MRKSVLIVSMLVAWTLAAVFSQIKNITGLEFDGLLYAAISTMIFGLYKGLYKTTNKNQAKKEL